MIFISIIDLATVDIFTTQRHHLPGSFPGDEDYRFTYNTSVFTSYKGKTIEKRIMGELNITQFGYHKPEGNNLKSFMLYKTWDNFNIFQLLYLKFLITYIWIYFHSSLNVGQLYI